MTDQTDARVLRAELKAAAVQAGIVDADAVALLPLDGVSLGTDGNMKLPDGYFDAARQARPWLFKSAAATSTGNPTAPPPPGDLKPRRAADMTEAERRAWLAREGVSMNYRRR